MPDQANNLTLAPGQITAAELDGLAFDEAFRKFVLEDPGVVAAGKRVVAEGHGYGELFATSEFPRGGYRWPVKLTADDLISAFTYVPITILGGGYEPPKPPAAASLQTAATILADCWDLLVGFLVRGEVVAADMDGNELGKSAWRRPNATIDIQSGDLFDGDNDEPLRRGLMLQMSQLDAEKPLVPVGKSQRTSVSHGARSSLSPSQHVAIQARRTVRLKRGAPLVKREAAKAKIRDLIQNEKCTALDLVNMKHVALAALLAVNRETALAALNEVLQEPEFA